MVIAAVVVFVALACYQLDLPGLYYDEAADAVPAMQIVLGQPIELSRNAGIPFAGRTWPLMVMDYVGSVSTYLLVPSVAIIGVKPEAVRAVPIAVGALSLLVGYGFLRLAFGVGVGLAATWLVAIHPSFVFWTRQGIHVSSIMLICSTGALWLLLRWWRGRGWWNLVGGAALLGLGISIKLLFLWFPVALLVTAMLLYPPFRRRARAVAFDDLPIVTQPVSVRNGHSPDRAASASRLGGTTGPAGVALREPLVLPPTPQPRREAIRRAFPFIRWRELPAALLAAAAFVAGAGFIIIYNVQTAGTIKVLSENAVTTTAGVDNRALLTNLATRLDSFGSYLRGDHFWYLGGIYQDAWYPALFVVAILVLLLLVMFDRPARRAWRQPAFLLVMIGIIVLESTITVSGLGPTHFYILYPLPQTIIALAAVWLSRRCRSGVRRGAVLRARSSLLSLAGVVLAGGGVATLTVLDLRVDAAYHTALTRTGGYGNHSDAMYDLVDYLVEWKGHQPVAMDWGIAKTVQFLSKGAVNPPELFGYTGPADPTFEDRIQPYLAKPFTLYIFHDEESTVYPRYRAFADAVKAYGKYVHRDLTIEQRDGKIIFRAYTARVDG